MTFGNGTRVFSFGAVPGASVSLTGNRLIALQKNVVAGFVMYFGVVAARNRAIFEGGKLAGGILHNGNHTSVIRRVRTYVGSTQLLNGNT